jgi:hypothetical protein
MINVIALLRAPLLMHVSRCSEFQQKFGLAQSNKKVSKIKNHRVSLLSQHICLSSRARVLTERTVAVQCVLCSLFARRARTQGYTGLATRKSL